MRAGHIAAVGVAALLLGALPAPSNASHASYAPTNFSQTKAVTTWRTSGDSIWVFSDESWNSTDAAAVRGYSAQGYRYTQDMRDLDNNVNATGNTRNTDWRSNFPNPVYDRDDDNSDYRWEESEVTAERGRRYVSTSQCGILL